MHRLLVGGLGAASSEIEFERPLPEVHGRADALLGRTVFEFKSDLRREAGDAEEELARYLSQREAATGERFVGVATDGAVFTPYELRGGELRRLGTFIPTAEDPRETLAWLDGAVVISANLPPDTETVRRQLGRESLAWHVARGELAVLFEEVSDRPDVRLKRELWARLLERVYGSPVDDDALFFQHTYLSVVAKTIAVQVLGIELPEPEELLSGLPFQRAGITGAVESDFFSWLLAAREGARLVQRISVQTARFELRDVKTDVLKGLYESLIDPEQRKYLGEYYTPDWLAARVCDSAIEAPLEQRVVDPACGSGAFLFHAVRRFLAAASEAGLSNHDALSRCCRQILGIDVHPLAVQIARVTYLLALGEERLRNRPPLTLPVYLGDSLQWNTRGFLADREVLIEVPEDGPVLEFPVAVTKDPALFDEVIARMLELSETNSPVEALSGWLQRQHGLDDRSTMVLGNTYQDLCSLSQEGRNHIWGFVARNLSRPVWLSQPDERADVVIGNPPWLAFNFMTRGTQEPFRKECQRLGVWVGGRGITPHQDLSAYFFARCVELYLKPTGTIAFIMPLAAMSRRQYAAFRTGVFATRRGRRIEQIHASILITQAWTFSDDVQPLFPVPSCVLFAQNEPASALGEPSPRRLPERVLAASGTLPRRDATPVEAEDSLQWRDEAWPEAREEMSGSEYTDTFRQGAIFVPRMTWTVEYTRTGILGGDRALPLVESRRTNLEKPPWRDAPSFQGNIEGQFIRPLYAGASVAPFRVLESVLCITPWDPEQGCLLDAETASQAGYASLARWLRDAEELWDRLGRGTRTLLEELDFFGQLSAQLEGSQSRTRLVYTQAGRIQAAAIISDANAVIDHKLYWAPFDDPSEARYLAAILNSETLRARIEHLQSRGQWGARDFDKALLSQPIPRFSSRNRLHAGLAAAAQRAEEVAGGVDVGERYFVRSRKDIREALTEDGVMAEIEGLVEELL